MKIVFFGTIGQSGLGGQAWAGLQYLIGFRELGHEVIYVEDCGDYSWVYNWATQEWTDELAYPAAYVRDCLTPFGFGKQWLYRAGDKSEGMALADYVKFCEGADLLIMRAVPLWVWRKEFDLPRRRIFIDVDPGFTQMTIAGGDQGFADAIARNDRLFTFGQNIGAPGSTIPTNNWTWLKTLPPVALFEWPFDEGMPASHFTSIMRWDGFRNAEYKGVVYGQKDLVFPQYFDLPRRTGQAFRMAINGPDLPPEYEWACVPGEKATQTPFTYRDFIQQSRAEFGVAKHGYVQMRSGWFRRSEHLLPRLRETGSGSGYRSEHGNTSRQWHAYLSGFQRRNRRSAADQCGLRNPSPRGPPACGRFFCGGQSVACLDFSGFGLMTQLAFNPLRIAILVGTFPVVSETFILRQITGLLDLGHEVDIYADSRPEPGAPVHAEVEKYRLLERTVYMDMPPESAPWEMPVWPLTGKTWPPGESESIRNLTRVARAIPKLWRPFLTAPRLACQTLSPSQYGYQAASLSALYRLARLASQRKRYDVIHAHFGPVGNSFRFARALWKAPLVVSFHGYDFTTLPRRGGGPV